MSTSAIPALIDRLVSTSKASVTLGAAPLPVTICDGPVVSGDYPKLALWFGVDANYLMSAAGTVAPISGQAVQQWIGIGGHVREEVLTVHCVADAWIGETDTRTARIAAYSIMSAFEDMTRLDANAGGTVLFTDPGVTNSVLYQGETSVGARVLVAFDFTCKARIGS